MSGLTPRTEQFDEMPDNVVDIDALTDSEKLDLILQKMLKVEEMTATVIEQVKPTLDELMNSSLVKMLGLKKGK